MNIRYHILMDEPCWGTWRITSSLGPGSLAPQSTPSLTSPASGGLDLTQQTSSLLHPGHGVAFILEPQFPTETNLKTSRSLTNKNHGSHQIGNGHVNYSKLATFSWLCCLSFGDPRMVVCMYILIRIGISPANVTRWTGLLTITCFHFGLVFLKPGKSTKISQFA